MAQSTQHAGRRQFTDPAAASEIGQHPSVAETASATPPSAAGEALRVK
jgi:hypothetical protein